MLVRFPSTLFGKTALTIAAVLILFQVFTSLVIAYYLLIPVARRSANDMADFMLLSARVWAKLPVSERADFQEVLRNETGLILLPADDEMPGATVYMPYARILGKALGDITRRPVKMKVEQTEGKDWYWVDFYSEGRLLRVGFTDQRIDIHAPLAILLILVLGTTATLLATLILVRRLTRPLSLLSDAAERIGRGGAPEPLPEIGPSELVSLVRTFNKMAHQVSNLLASRSTLLAGIAHDLRTPIARMKLALEVLPHSADPELSDRMRRGLDTMSRLVSQSLEFGRGVVREPGQEVDVVELIEELAEDVRQNGVEIHLRPSTARIHKASPMALRRILTNLLDNAIRHGENGPIDVACEYKGERLRISIADRGPGIPADELEAVFEPFYKVDKSRGRLSGGCGLGLAIARQLAESNDWTLGLEPRAGGGLVAFLAL